MKESVYPELGEGCLSIPFLPLSARPAAGALPAKLLLGSTLWGAQLRDGQKYRSRLDRGRFAWKGTEAERFSRRASPLRPWLYV